MENEQTRIKVFHIEDYQIMRDGIRALIENTDDIEVVGEAKNGEEVIDALEMPIDVVILDIFLDAMEDLTTPNGFQVCRAIIDKFPTIKIVAHSVYDDADRVAQILKAGAVGFVSKKSGFNELIEAIRTVHEGRPYICARTAARLKNLTEFLSGFEHQLKNKAELFSSREREVLQLLAQGHSSKEIADSLFITERTVESHRKNMMEKAHARNTAELMAYASTLGLIRK